MFNVGDEVVLRNGDTMVITYISISEVEGFSSRGWMLHPSLGNIVDVTGRHFDLPITKE